MIYQEVWIEQNGICRNFREGAELTKKTSIAIYTLKGIGLISIFSLMIIVSLLNLFLDGELLANFLYFSGAVVLLITVGWMAFAFMGRIELDGQNLLVFRNFKCYRFPLSSVTFYFGKNRPLYRGSYEWPLFIVGEALTPNGRGQKVTLKLIGSKWKNRQFQQFIQEHLEGKMLPLPKEDSWKLNAFGQLEIIEDEVREEPKSALAVTRKLSDFIEFGADQGNVKKTVFYDIKRNALFVGKSVSFPMIFLPSAGFSYGLYVLTKNLTVRGLFPLLFSFIFMLLLALYQFKNRREKSVVEVVPYEMPRDYFATQKSNGLKTYALIFLFALISAVFSWLYLLFGSFLLLFLTIVIWYCFLFLLLSGQFKKTKYLKVLEKSKVI